MSKCFIFKFFTKFLVNLIFGDKMRYHTWQTSDICEGKKEKLTIRVLWQFHYSGSSGKLQEGGVFFHFSDEASPKKNPTPPGVFLSSINLTGKTTFWGWGFFSWGTKFSRLVRKKKPAPWGFSRRTTVPFSQHFSPRWVSSSKLQINLNINNSVVLLFSLQTNFTKTEINCPCLQ